MASEQIGSSRNKEHRAVTTQERQMETHEEFPVSLTHDESVQTGKSFAHYVCPFEGELVDLHIFVERSMPQKVLIEIVCGNTKEDMVTVRKFEVKQGPNTFEGFEVRKWERLGFRLASDESKIEGIWIGFNLKRG